MDVLYFAWVRERIGLPRERVETEALTVRDLVAELTAREDRYAAAFADVTALRVAVDQELTDFDAPLTGVREVAFFSTDDGRLMRVRVQDAGFDAGAELNAFSAAAAGAGAVVSFTGVVRDVTGGLRHMIIEHYPGMTERAISAMVEQAVARWHLTDALVIHRFGPLAPGAPIMMVATAAAHRAEAFAAADFLMDYLKSRAPFWKQEVTAEGTAWVAAKAEDEAALRRWD